MAVNHLCLYGSVLRYTGLEQAPLTFEGETRITRQSTGQKISLFSDTKIEEKLTFFSNASIPGEIIFGLGNGMDGQNPLAFNVEVFTVNDESVFADIEARISSYHEKVTIHLPGLFLDAFIYVHRSGSLSDQQWDQERAGIYNYSKAIRI